MLPLKGDSEEGGGGEGRKEGERGQGVREEKRKGGSKRVG